MEQENLLVLGAIHWLPSWSSDLSKCLPGLGPAGANSGHEAPSEEGGRERPEASGDAFPKQAEKLSVSKASPQRGEHRL